MFNNSRDPFDNFDRSFNRMTRVFWVMFSLIAVIILAGWIAMATIGVAAYEMGPDAIANKVGHTIGTFLRSVDDAREKQ